jgi:hypothetical protein
MNERIRKIAQETDAWCDQNYFGKDSYDIEWETMFAELIVRECMNTIAESREARQTSYYYRNRVAEHFGVKE